ncbi:MAG: ComEC/Rec2 family competence protein [Clostridia bacterium]|nr:ComEC/Rec2 family competence protein [Clostridia bacterium]
MDAVLNRRYVLGAALCLCAGVLTGAFLQTSLILRIVIPIATAAVGILLLFGKKKFLFCAFLCFALGVSVLSADYAVALSDRTEGLYVFEGRVAGTDERTVVFDELTFDQSAVKGKARGEREDFSEVQEGQIIKVFVEATRYEVDWTDFGSTSRFNDRVYYHLTPYGEQVTTGEKKNVFEKIRDRVKGPLSRYCAAEDAGIAESLLFGDKSDLSESDEAVINGIGMSHVFAVSGLHVGFLTAAVAFVLKRLRIKPLPRLVATALLLLVYGFLTGFPAGLKRAAIMTLLYMLAPIVRGKSDAPTSLGAACFVIVLTNPRELFDLGFLMSVSAVAGILLFTRPIAKGLRNVLRAKNLGRVCDGVALTVGSNILLFPILCDVFGKIALFAPVSNVLLLPVVTLTYTYIAVVAFLTAIIPYFGVLFFPIKYPILLIRGVGSLLASVPFSTISVPALGAWWILYIFGWLFLCRLNKLPKKWKIPLGAICILTSGVGFFL